MYSGNHSLVFFQLQQEIEAKLKKDAHEELIRKNRGEIFSKICQEMGERLKEGEQVATNKITEKKDGFIQVANKIEAKKLTPEEIDELRKKLEHEVLIPSTLFPKDNIEDNIANKDDKDEDLYTRYGM